MPGCCGGSSRKNTAAFGVLSLLLVIAVAGWVREAMKPPQVTQVELVEVVVAAKDLTTGTAFTKESIDTQTTTKRIPKAELPHNVITSKYQMLGKRLSRATHEGEFFNVADVNNKTARLFEMDKEMFIRKTIGDELVGPYSRVDILASFGEGTERVDFLLLPDVMVLEVSGGLGPLPQRRWVSFAVDEKQSKLISLANEAECYAKLRLRDPSAPVPKFDYNATLARLEMLLAKKYPAPPPRVVGNP